MSPKFVAVVVIITSVITMIAIIIDIRKNKANNDS